MTDHDHLAELLELADGERPLPPGTEDRLLAEVMETAGRPTDDASDVELVVLRNPDVDRPPRTGWWTAPRVAAAAVAACLALVVLALPETTGLRIEQPGPAATVAPGRLSDGELCTTLGSEVSAAGLLAEREPPAYRGAAAFDARRLASLFAELATRLPTDGEPDPSSVARVELRLRSTALVGSRGTPTTEQAAFEAVWRELSAAPGLRRLLAGGCAGGLG